MFSVYEGPPGLRTPPTQRPGRYPGQRNCRDDPGMLKRAPAPLPGEVNLRIKSRRPFLRVLHRWESVSQSVPSAGSAVGRLSEGGPDLILLLHRQVGAD